MMFYLGLGFPVKFTRLPEYSRTFMDFVSFGLNNGYLRVPMDIHGSSVFKSTHALFCVPPSHSEALTSARK